MKDKKSYAQTTKDLLERARQDATAGRKVAPWWPKDVQISWQEDPLAIINYLVTLVKAQESILHGLALGLDQQDAEIKRLNGITPRLKEVLWTISQQASPYPPQEFRVKLEKLINELDQEVPPIGLEL